MTSIAKQDLDALVPLDRVVTLGGTDYTIPGDMPMEIYLRVNAAGETDDEAEAVGHIHTAVTDLLSWHITDEVRRAQIAEGLKRYGIGTLMKFVREIYKDQDEEAKEQEGEAGNSPAPSPERVEETPTSTASTPTTTGTSPSAESPIPSLAE